MSSKTLNILILGASYGSLFGTKCAMAGHAVTLVCRSGTAALINREGTVVRLRLKDEPGMRAIRSRDLSGHIVAATPDQVDPAGYDLAVLAMQEPQYASHAIRQLLGRIAEARVPCLSLMNMPPLPYLKRIASIDADAVEGAYADARVWDRFDPALISLCSPDPQAVRPQGEPANVLQVGLATNFKAACLPMPYHNETLATLARDIDTVRLGGADIPVKLRLHASPFVPFAKWPMLLAGNYRCVTGGVPVSIRDAVHDDLALSREIYSCVETIATRIGAMPGDMVAFDKYAAAAAQLANPSSAARALATGAPVIERVDKLVQLIGLQHGIAHPAIDRTVALIDALTARNAAHAA